MSEHWERVTSLFGAARVLDPAARASFLGLACRDDQRLRGDIEALLAGDVPDDGFLADPPWARVAPTLETTLTSGQVLKNRYRVDSELASGSQARVYRATDELLTRSVVIKVMRVEGRRNAWLKSRFEDEMHALARIDHPGVVGILDVGDLDDGSSFLVIQHIPGMSLREALANGPLSPERAAGLLRQIGSALRAAHAQGIAHRDVKPENIMLQQRDGAAETVKLIDFGIAKIDKSGLDPSTTAVIVAGTVRYMAPEQFEGENSPASDIYSMGLVACEMLGGYPDIRALAKSTRADTRAALEEAIAFRPGDRPSDVQRWSERLAETLVERRSRVKKPATVVAVGVLLCALAVPAVRWIIRQQAEPPRIVEKVGGFDPLTEGFKTRDDVTGTIVENAARTGYDGWRVSTRQQGYYFQPFSNVQKRRALTRGWKLTAVMSAGEGSANVGVDFAGVGERFNVNVLADGNQETVRLLTQIIPVVRGLDFQQVPAHGYHRYELIYDPSVGTADLWIDNERRITGYRGFNQFVEDRGLLFGASVYKSDHGAASFKSVRFEINP